jgi:hypothetical protein
VIKVYSVTFSLIYEHEKEQRLSSVTYSHAQRIVFIFTQALKQNKTMLGIDFIFTQACLDLVSFLHKLEPGNYA